MGKTCTWCGNVLRASSGASISSGSHALCHGCREELQAALSNNGLRPSHPKPLLN